MIYKILWAFVALLYAPFFKKIKFPTYIGLPNFTLGLAKVTVGKRVRIFPGMRIEVYNSGEIIFSDNVSIGQNFHITAGQIPLVIGEGSTILGNVFVTNIDHQYINVRKRVLDQEMIVTKTEIGKNCFVGYGSGIQAGTILGNHCIVGAHSLVKGVFPDYCVIVGSPARIIKQYNINTGKWEKVNK